MHTVRIENIGRVFVDEEALSAHFSPKEISLLRFVMSRKGVATYDMMLTGIYAGWDEPQTKTLAVFVCNLRRKLADHRDMVQTIWARGYTSNPEYSLIASDGGATIDLDAETADLLVLTAFESDMTTSELAALVLREGLEARRTKLWAA